MASARAPAALALLVVLLDGGRVPAASPPPTRRVPVALPLQAGPPERPVRAVVLVTIDGVRWQDVFARAELTPTLHRWMTDAGVAFGAPGHGEVWATGPNYVSLPGYVEILTGHPSPCQANEGCAVTGATFLDAARARDPGVFAVGSWETLARAVSSEPERLAMSVGRHGAHGLSGVEPLLEEGRAASPVPGTGDYRPDAITTRMALALYAQRVPLVSFVGLGDTDEHAHHGDRAAYLASLGAADRFLGELEASIDDRTAVFVTADHGRADSFAPHGAGWHESGRSFLVVRAPSLAPRGLVDAPRTSLSSIAPTITCLLGLGGSSGALAPICGG